MPTIFSHPAVPLGIAPWLRSAPRSLIAVAALVSLLPDADVAAFGFGIPYEHPLGHRGFTHSIAFAFVFTVSFSDNSDDSLFDVAHRRFWFER